MDLSRTAVQRPISIMMLFVSILLIGTISLTKLPVDLMPNVGSKKISIITRVRGGMPPTEVEELVSRPIEDAVSTATGVELLTSKSEKGESQVVIIFEPGTDMEFAALEVREKFAKVKNKLPKEIERPIIARYDETDVYVMIAAVTSKKYTTEYLRRVIDEDIKEYLLRVEGVANVDVYGGRERKILVEFDQDKLDSYGVSIMRAIDKLGINNLNLLGGKVAGERDKYTLRTIGEFETVEEIRDIPLETTNLGSIIRLKDVAEVNDTFIDAENYARLGIGLDRRPKDIVSLYIHKESEANTIKVVEGIRNQIDGPIRDGLSKMGLMMYDDIDIEIISDQAEFIIKAIDTVKQSLMYGAILAAIVLLFFLRNIRSTLIIFTSIPTSVVATFALMYIRNMINPEQQISINVMTLSGLALGIGMLVDNSIVVLENIFSKQEQKLDRIEAAVSGTKEVFLAIVASTLTTIVVFLPIIFVTEDIKMLYGALALTVTFSLLTSLFVALTLMPCLSSRFLAMKNSGIDLSKLKIIYQKCLTFVFRRRYKFVIAAFLVFGICVLIFRGLDRELLGQTEQGKFTIFARLEAGAKVEISNQMVKEIEDLLAKHPAVANYSTRVEGYSSRLYVSLVPFADRVKLDKKMRSTEDIIEGLWPSLKEIERRYRGGFVYIAEIQAPGMPEVKVDVYGHNYDKLNELISEIGQSMVSVPGMVDLKRSIEPGRPEYRIIPNKEKAAFYGLTTKEIADIVHAQMRGLRATLFHTESKEVETVARLEEGQREDFDDIKNLLITTPQGESVYLKQVADFVPSIGPSEIHRKNKNRYIELSGTSTILSLSKALKQIKQSLKDLKLPRDYYWEFGGDYEKQVRNQRQLMYSLVLALALVYMILASLFESYYQPFIIMISIPLALIGAILTLWLTKTSVGIGVIIGGIMLVGIVVNNAIILVDRVNGLREKNYRLLRAIIQSGKDRLRPILLTTGTTVLTLVPMALDKSEASNLWSPLAITVIGGLLLSTILTLILIPSIYIIFEDIVAFFERNTLHNKFYEFLKGKK
ncbi:MAG: efflux RND transporter permease subunit [Candidatus Omnitrophica bacterium]|nr:efflux RND transporter permease subunit [Candidatus Omnitrophota bacterium]